MVSVSIHGNVRLMDLFLNLPCLVLGLVVMAHDHDIADALNALPFWISELTRQRDFGWKGPKVSPPSREGFET
jgi:hypothetical protein